MKRFGGFEFPSIVNTDIITLFDENFFTRLSNIMNRTNQTETIDAAKVASLFEINPPQASVNKNKLEFFKFKYSISLRFGIIIKDGHQV